MNKQGEYNAVLNNYNNKVDEFNNANNDLRNKSEKFRKTITLTGNDAVRAVWTEFPTEVKLVGTLRKELDMLTKERLKMKKRFFV